MLKSPKRWPGNQDTGVIGDRGGDTRPHKQSRLTDMWHAAGPAGSKIQKSHMMHKSWYIKKIQTWFNTRLGKTSMASQYLQFTFQKEKAETMEVCLNDDHGKLLLMPHLIHHHAHCGTERSHIVDIQNIFWNGHPSFGWDCFKTGLAFCHAALWVFGVQLPFNFSPTPPSLPTPLVSYQTTSTIVLHQKTESLHQGEHLVDWHHHHEQLLPHLRWTVH